MVKRLLAGAQEGPGAYYRGTDATRLAHPNVDSARTVHRQDLTAMTPLVLEAAAVLFDCDGVLVDSDASVDRAWRRWADRYGQDRDRVAHLHFLIFKEGFKTLISQIYTPDDDKLETDAQFGVTRALIGDYVRHDGPAPSGEAGEWFSLDQNFVMEPGKSRLPKPPIL